MRLLEILILFIVIIGCNSNKNFDSKTWKQNETDWWITDVREKMIDDLIQSDTLQGLNKTQIIELLGLPTKDGKFEMIYLIREKYGRDIDPVYISELLIQLDGSGKVIEYEVVN